MTNVLSIALTHDDVQLLVDHLQGSGSEPLALLADHLDQRLRDVRRYRADYDIAYAAMQKASRPGQRKK